MCKKLGACFRHPINVPYFKYYFVMKCEILNLSRNWNHIFCIPPNFSYFYFVNKAGFRGSTVIVDELLVVQLWVNK